MEEALSIIACFAACLEVLALWCLLAGARTALSEARRLEEFLRARGEYSSRVLAVRRKRRERARELQAAFLPPAQGTAGSAVGPGAPEEGIPGLAKTVARVKENPRMAAAVIESLIRT